METKCSCGLGQCPMHDPPELGKVIAGLIRGPSVPQTIIANGTTWARFKRDLLAERKRRVNAENGG